MKINSNTKSLSAESLWILSEIRNKSVSSETIPANLDTFEYLGSAIIPWSDNWDVVKGRKTMLAAYLRLLECEEYIEITRTPEHSIIKDGLSEDIEISSLDYFQSIKLLPKGWNADIDYEKLRDDLKEIFDESQQAVDEGR